MNLRRSARFVLTYLGLAWPMWEITERLNPAGDLQGPIFLALFLPTWTALSVWLGKDGAGETKTSNEEDQRGNPA